MDKMKCEECGKCTERGVFFIGTPSFLCEDCAPPEEIERGGDSFTESEWRHARNNARRLLGEPVF